MKNMLIWRSDPASSAPQIEPLSEKYIMAVALRLRQEGAHNRPVFRIVAVEHRKKRDGGFLEILGYYDPQKEKNGCNIDLAKVDAWIAKGAQASDTVRSLVKKARAAAK